MKQVAISVHVLCGMGHGACSMWHGAWGMGHSLRELCPIDDPVIVHIHVIEERISACTQGGMGGGAGDIPGGSYRAHA